MKQLSRGSKHLSRPSVSRTDELILKRSHIALGVYLLAQCLPALMYGHEMIYGGQLTWAGPASVYRLLRSLSLDASHVACLLGFSANVLFVVTYFVSLLRYSSVWKPSLHRSSRTMAISGLFVAIVSVLPILIATKSFAIAVLIPTTLPLGSIQKAAPYFLLDFAGNSKVILSVGHFVWLVSFTLLCRGISRSS